MGNKDKEKDKVTKPNGVDDATFDKYNTNFSASDKFASLDKEKNSAASNYKDIANTKNIISSSTKKAMNQKFVVPSAVTEADGYLKTQLEKIQSGKTSYSDQVRDMMDKIMNRDKFSYDVDKDPLFQQALASAMNSGKQAMQDTIGQTSALTGGYGSTYATSAGNQAYNAFIEDAYDNLPQYYQMAMEAYQMEGDEMYRQFGMLSDADDKEYNRNVTAYDATYQYRNQLYNEAYAQFRDNKSDAFATANLELSEHGQRSSDAYNYYNIASNQADTQYEREYKSWEDSINQAYQMMSMQNTDWWNQTNFDEGVRQYEKNYAENVRQFDKTYAQNEDHFTRNLNFQASENAKDRAVKAAGGGNGTKLSSGFSLTNPEIEKCREILENGGTRDDVLDYLALSGNIPANDEDDSVLDSVLGIGYGEVKNFRDVTNDNFDVTVRGKDYRVENHGKVTDEKTTKQLDKVSKGDGKAFIYNDNAYVEHGGSYYKIGATSIFGINTKGYQNLLKALK